VARAVSGGTRTDVVLLIISGSLALAAIAMPANLRDPLAAFLRRTLCAPLIVVQGKAELARQALVHHDAQTAERDSVVLKSMLVPGLEAENERLRRMLGLGHALKWGFVPAEALRGRTPGEDFTMTLTAGAKAGVRPFSAVIAPEGLVGMVESTDPTTSQAISWAHPDFRVSAMTADGGAFGIVRAYQGSGGDRYLLELSGVQLSTTLAPGTLIVSSGVGGVYPRGIPVGTITRELSTTEGWARTYLVKPAVKPQDITSVLVVEPRRAIAGIQSVYAAAADSEARADSAAADSADAAIGNADSAVTAPAPSAPPPAPKKRSAVTAPPTQAAPPGASTQ
jgi:rod shape-determining protein MreC